jgi:nucleotide-binding universal stress UspA family protein
VIIFAERLKEGAWTYFLFIPILYVAFTYFRNKLGAPSPVLEELGKLEEAMWTTEALVPSTPETVEIAPVPQEVWSASPERIALWRSKKRVPKNILIPLDGSSFAENALPAGKFLAAHYNAVITLLSVAKDDSGVEEMRSYLGRTAESIAAEGIKVSYEAVKGRIPEAVSSAADRVSADMVIMTTHGRTGLASLLRKSRAVEILRSLSIPSVIIRPREGQVPPPRIDRVLVPLDGSLFSEKVLSYVRALDPSFNSTVILLSVPDVPEPGLYGTLADVVARLRRKAEAQSRSYLEAIANVLREDGLKVETVVTGSNPVRTILRVSEEKKVTLIMMSAKGRGAESQTSRLGGVAVRVLKQVRRPLFLLPVHKDRG